MILQLSYDHTQLNAEKVHDVILKQKAILSWWHYLPNVYLLETSTTDERDIANVLIKEIPGLRFFISKIDINSTNGLLPKDAWTWIDEKGKLSRTYSKMTNPAPSQNFDRVFAELFENNQKIVNESKLIADFLNNNGK